MIFRRDEHRRWAHAHTMADLGELTAQWLEGRIRHHPGYCGGGPDPETLPRVRTLAAVNRAGFVTTGSQPGDANVIGGVLWKQRAVVDGFADDLTLALLSQAALGTRLEVRAHRAAPGRTTFEDALVCTREGGRPYTSFGATLGPGDLQLALGPAWRIALPMWQVMIADLEWGSNRVLWPTLDRFATQAMTPHARAGLGIMR